MDIVYSIDDAIDCLEKCQTYLARGNAIEAEHWFQNALTECRRIQNPLSERAAQQDREEEERLRKKREACKNGKNS